MSKKIELFLFIILSCCFVHASYADFNPEDAYFSKMRTIKRWVDSKYHRSSKRMGNIQKFVALMVPQNMELDSHRMAGKIPNDDGVEQDFGNVHKTREALEEKFLLYVAKVAKKKPPITLEMGAGTGMVSWKIPLTYFSSGTHYVNELSSKALKFFREFVFDIIYGRLGLLSLSRSMIEVPGSCFEILDKHPDLKESVNAIYVQDLEHYFNPVKHREFIALLDALLAPGGKAFLCADTILANNEESDLYQLYLGQEKSGVMYPGFLQYTVSKTMEDGGGAIVMKEGEEVFMYGDIDRPADNTPTYKREIYKRPVSSDGIDAMQRRTFAANGILCPKIYDYTHECLFNHFTPYAYRKSIENHPRLECEDSFYMDDMGERQDDWSRHATNAAMIIRKKSREEEKEACLSLLWTDPDPFNENTNQFMINPVSDVVRRLALLLAT